MSRHEEQGMGQRGVVQRHGPRTKMQGEEDARSDQQRSVSSSLFRRGPRCALAPPIQQGEREQEHRGRLQPPRCAKQRRHGVKGLQQRATAGDAKQGCAEDEPGQHARSCTVHVGRPSSGRAGLGFIVATDHAGSPEEQENRTADDHVQADEHAHAERPPHA